VLDVVSARLNLRPVSPGGKAGLRDLHWSLFLLDAQLDHLDVLLHVKDLLQNLHIQAAHIHVHIYIASTARDNEICISWSFHIIYRQSAKYGCLLRTKKLFALIDFN